MAFEIYGRISWEKNIQSLEDRFEYIYSFVLDFDNQIYLTMGDRYKI